MTTEVIILAQGSQQRLGMRHGYKQLLRLPACGGVTILSRTLFQLQKMSVATKVALVATNPFMGEFILTRPIAPSERLIDAIWKVLHLQELPDPGNSSLKGIARYLEQRAGESPERTIVLFGDVVYSWSCLEWIRQCSENYGFVGTANLSSGGGELWGVAWAREYEDEMIRTLRDALLRHPPFNDEYQPGQMRRWITGWRRGVLADHVKELARRGHYAAVDDYTHDIDLPSDIALLPELSVAAAKDDTDHEAYWL